AFLFPGTGSVTVPVEVKFVGASPAPLAVELVAEGAEDDAGALALRNLAPAHPRSEWTRFVASPFATGYRRRIAGNPDWSEVVREPSGTPLRLTAAGGDVRREKEDDMDDEEFSAAGLRLVRTGDPGGREWAFLPETPAI